MKSLRIELVPRYSTCIRRDDNDIRIGEVDELAKRDKRLVRAMEVLQMARRERVLDLTRVDIQRDYPRNPEVLAEMSEHRSGKGLPSRLLMLARVRICGKHERNGLGACKLHGIDRSEEEHEVVIH